ncbi:MAG: hypothetical protein ACD_49C00008G0006 [uncultured bacterium (gcode 4)]|uniref:Uncharacterized protein n=1 Tax=uncultured bacterium (gcode 4) TaxID=1234023 RepID=K2AYL1_9BACT|nr:MAG: hypothetical protein ACD_49C00008G0006 [uncultured bacterium (gcode 4)]
MVLFSVDSRANSTLLDEAYQTIISAENKSEIEMEKVKNLVFNLLDLHLNWNEKNWTNWSIEKVRDLMEKFKQNLSNDDFKAISHWEILASCRDRWAAGLKKIWIKKIKVWSRYNIVWIDMITKELLELKELQELIIQSFAIERRYELRYGQMCKSFELAATKLGILDVEKQVKYSEEETVESVKKYGDTNYSSTIVTFESGKIEVLDNIHYSSIKKWDKFSFIYTDPEHKTQLQIILLNGSWLKKQEWVSQEYIELQKEDRTNFVEIVMG